MKRYSNSVVTFLDILGFREIIKSKNADEVSSILDGLAATAAAPVGLGAGQTEVVSFSDSIVRVRAASPELAYEALRHEVQDLAAAQWSLLEAGILVRGGITIGKVTTAPGRAFGPAFVRAYDLEHSLASAPRIVIDPSVVTSLRTHVRKVSGFSARREAVVDIRNHLRLGSDGLWFVDYMACVSKIMLNQADSEAGVRKFRPIIIQKATELTDDSLYLPKILWLIRYYNASCKRIFPAKRDLKITKSDVPLSDELLIPALAKLKVSKLV